MPSKEEKNKLMSLALGINLEDESTLKTQADKIIRAIASEYKHNTILELFDQIDMEDRKLLIEALIHEDNLHEVGYCLAQKYYPQKTLK